jgi:hypothetical protein
MKKNPFSGKISTSLFMGMGLILMLVAGLIFLAVRDPAPHPFLQDFMRNLTQKTHLLSGMQTNLFKSEQAEKSAVMADTDEASMTFADQSRQAAESVENGRRELESLIEKDPTDKEKQLLREFNESWRELQKIDQEILDFAVQNTNLKAMALSFGKGGEVMHRFENALGRLISSGLSVDSPCRVTVLASQALISGFKIYNLHALHIAEQRDEKMDEIEALMNGHSKAIEALFSELMRTVGGEDRVSLQEAITAHAELTALTAEVVDLSRRNTNVKSFQLSIGRKRRMVAQCDGILISLLETVRDREFKATR